MIMNFRPVAKSVIYESLDDENLALKMVKNANLVSDGQKKHRDALLEFCDSHDKWLHRQCLEGHLTASAYIFNKAMDSLLMIDHRKIGIWLQPGGHCDGDGNLLNVAVKEVHEETGLSDLDIMLPACDISVHHIDSHQGVQEHKHLDIRFAMVARSEDIVVNEVETMGCEWVQFADERLKIAGIAERVIKLGQML